MQYQALLAIACFAPFAIALGLLFLHTAETAPERKRAARRKASEKRRAAYRASMAAHRAA